MNEPDEDNTNNHRMIFNLSVFPELFENEQLLPADVHPKSSICSSVMSETEWREALNIVPNFGPAKIREANEEQKNFRNSLEPDIVKKWTRFQNIGKHLIELFKVENSIPPGRNTQQPMLFRLHKRKNWHEEKWLRCIPQLQVFDAIRACHLSKSSHFSFRKTITRVQDIYYNISRKQVQEYIDTCEICKNKRNSRKSTKHNQKILWSLMILL
jgi:hypothetical protein